MEILPGEVEQILEFLRSAEKLKDTLRSGYTTQGAQKAPPNIPGGSVSWPCSWKIGTQPSTTTACSNCAWCTISARRSTAIPQLSI